MIDEEIRRMLGKATPIFLLLIVCSVVAACSKKSVSSTAQTESRPSQVTPPVRSARTYGKGDGARATGGSEGLYAQSSGRTDKVLFCTAHKCWRRSGVCSRRRSKGAGNRILRLH